MRERREGDQEAVHEEVPRTAPEVVGARRVVVSVE
jgi:hypothetical protein